MFLCPIKWYSTYLKSPIYNSSVLDSIVIILVSEYCIPKYHRPGFLTLKVDFLWYNHLCSSVFSLLKKKKKKMVWIISTFSVAPDPL